MRTPINTELIHLAPGYDPRKAHEYYMRTRKLHPRKKGSASDSGNDWQKMARQAGEGPHAKKANTKTKQKLELQRHINELQNKLQKLEQLIHKKEAVLKRDHAQAKAKAHQKKDKPKTAAEKAKAARDNKKYRDKHKQELKSKAKQQSHKSGGGSSKGGSDKKQSINELKTLATKVKGQIAVAKQKLAAL